MGESKVVMSLYVDRFENNHGKPLVMVVANDASAGGNAPPYVVSGVDPASKKRQFNVWLQRDQLDLLIEAVTYEHRRVRYEGPAEVGATGGLGVVSVTDSVDPGTVVITDPGGGNNGPKDIVLKALAVDPSEVAAAPAAA